MLNVGQRKEYPMKCPSCGYEQKDDATVCGLCSKLLQPDEKAPEPQKVGGLPPHVQEEMEREEKLKQEQWEERRRERLKSHAITGAITFALINIIFGFPGSFHPFTLLKILFLSALFGLPLGYIISVRNGGLIQGALISSGVFALLRVVLSIPTIFQSNNPGVVLLSAAIGGILIGAIPGGIIGWHVDLSRT